jgi:hypothetical protein
MEMEHAQSGYEVRVTVRPEMPLGPFRLPMKIKTDLPGRNAEGALDKPLEFEILVTGMHRGPIQPFGGGWIDEKMAISLGAFDAAAGKKVRLPVFVKNPPEDGLKLTAAPVCIPAELKVDLEREERPNGKPTPPVSACKPTIRMGRTSSFWYFSRRISARWASPTLDPPYVARDGSKGNAGCRDIEGMWEGPQF